MKTSSAQSISSSAQALTSSKPTLRSGSKGAAVKELQVRLKAAGFNPGTADGAFGPKTLAAVKAFQKSRGLSADGVVGPKTWGKLLANPPATTGKGPVLK